MCVYSKLSQIESMKKNNKYLWKLFWGNKVDFVIYLVWSKCWKSINMKAKEESPTGSSCAFSEIYTIQADKPKVSNQFNKMKSIRMQSA